METRWLGFELLQTFMRSDARVKALVCVAILAALAVARWLKQRPAPPAAQHNPLFASHFDTVMEHMSETFMRGALRAVSYDPGVDVRYFVGGTEVHECGDETPPMRVRSEGRAARGELELELVGVPPALFDAARVLLRSLAVYSDTSAALGDASAFTFPPREGLIMAGRLVEKESFGARVLRVCDSEDTRAEEPARALLSSAAVFMARECALGEPKRMEDARRLLSAATVWFPGQPGLHASGDVRINQQNSLAYLTLSDLGIEREANYARALERDPELLFHELGSGPLAQVSREVLQDDADALVRILQHRHLELAGEPQAGTANEAGLLLSPLLRMKDGRLEQQLATGPLFANSYFYLSPARERLRDPGSVALVAELYARAVEDPLALLVRSMDAARFVFQFGFRFGEHSMMRDGPSFVSAAGSLGHLPVLSRILLALGRSYAAGLSDGEVRAHFGLTAERDDAAAAERKLTALRTREAAAAS